MKDQLQEIQEQHQKNYRMAIMDTIDENTDGLVQEDLEALFNDAPLESMDLLVGKITMRARQDHVILSHERLLEMVQKFRTEMKQELPSIGNYRKEQLKGQFGLLLDQKEEQTSSDTEECLEQVRDTLHQRFQKTFEEHLARDLVEELPTLLNESKNQDPVQNESFLTETNTYLTTRYQEQILTMFIDKVTFKDQILKNRLMEHAARHQFTMDHSHLLQDDAKKPIAKTDKRS